MKLLLKQHLMFLDNSELHTFSQQLISKLQITISQFIITGIHEIQLADIEQRSALFLGRKLKQVHLYAALFYFITQSNSS